MVSSSIAQNAYHQGPSLLTAISVGSCSGPRITSCKRQFCHAWLFWSCIASMKSSWTFTTADTLQIVQFASWKISASFPFLFGLPISFSKFDLFRLCRRLTIAGLRARGSNKAPQMKAVAEYHIPTKGSRLKIAKTAMSKKRTTSVTTRSRRCLQSDVICSISTAPTNLQEPQYTVISGKLPRQSPSQYLVYMDIRGSAVIKCSQPRLQWACVRLFFPTKSVIKQVKFVMGRLLVKRGVRKSQKWSLTASQKHAKLLDCLLNLTWLKRMHSRMSQIQLCRQ